jgi:hypothetical protein
MNETTWWLLGISAIWAVACYNWYRLGLRRGKMVGKQTAKEVGE